MQRYDGNYSSYYNVPGEQYPEGSAVDASGGDSYDGTPYKASFFNDVIGFMQAIFHRAFGNPYRSGETATRDVSGTSENAARSDVLDALDKIIEDRVKKAEDAAGDLGTLETEEKSSLVAAVNEVKEAADGSAAALGDLGALETEEKSSLVAAVNETHELAAEGKDWAVTAGFAGRNLLTVLGADTPAAAAAALQAKADARDYSGLRLGDWLEFAATYGEYGSVTAKWEIVAMGHYHLFWNGTQTTEWNGNIVLMPDKALFTRQMAASASQRKYFNSPMSTFLTSTVAPVIESALGVTLKQPQLYQFYNKGTNDAPDWWADTNSSTNHDWSDPAYFSRKVFLPSTREMSGEAGWGCQYWDNSVQFPLFANAPEKRVARGTDGTGVVAVWCRTPCRYPGYFCITSGDGCSRRDGAGAVHGVRPAICL